ncbi:MAG: hypothetical protein GY711_09855 [bacterium]|nr:hypothetical protein [bacterium]
MRARTLFQAVLPMMALGACATHAARESQSDAAAPSLASAGPDVGYDGGFFVRSEDGRSELLLEGLFQTVIGAFDSDRDPDSDVQLKRMRPELAGRFGSMRFRVEPKFTEDEVELEEAWVGTIVGGEDDLVMIGRMKAPFNLEEVRSRRHIDFPLFSIVNQFAPAEDHGVFWNGRGGAGRVEYGLAAYNGNGESDTNSSKDVAARVMLHPFAADEDSAFQSLQLGVAATVGTQDESVAGDAIDGPSGLEVVRFAPGAELDGGRERLGLEAAWYRGPWMVQAEYVSVDQEMSAGGADADIAFRGGYLTLSHVLTGEAKSFSGVRPDAPFDFESGSGRGAWVVALRLSRLDLDDDLEERGLALAGTFTDAIEGISLGVNWIPNEHTIVRNALILSKYEDDVRLDQGVDDEETAFLIEVQLHF